MWVYWLCFILMIVGLYAVLTKKNMLKIVIGLTIMEYSVNLFLVLIGYKSKGIAPIRIALEEKLMYVDPIPQALVLTSIVIGLSILALNIALCIRIFHKYRAYDITQVRRLKG